MVTFRSFVIVVFLMMGFTSYASGTESSENVAYFFPEGDICTLILDLQPQKPLVEKASGEARILLLAEKLLTEIKLHGDDKCVNSKKIRMMAVYIPGLDNYGRPDFGNRINLLRMDGDTAVIKDIKSDQFKDIETLKMSLETTIFE